MRLYEGMFLITQAEAQREVDAVMDHIRGLLEKCSCTPLRVDHWVEQKLAYDIRGQSKGSYFLTYFNAPHDAIDSLKRECQFSEMVTRVLILRKDDKSMETKILAEREAASKAASKFAPRDKKTPVEPAGPPAGSEGESRPAEKPVAETVKASAEEPEVAEAPAGENVEPGSPPSGEAGESAGTPREKAAEPPEHTSEETSGGHEVL